MTKTFYTVNFAQAYGENAYGQCTYNDTTSCTSTGGGSTGGGSSTGGGTGGSSAALTNTGLMVAVIVTLACLIALVSIFVRVMRRSKKAVVETVAAQQNDTPTRQR